MQDKREGLKHSQSLYHPCLHLLRLQIVEQPHSQRRQMTHIRQQLTWRSVASDCDCFESLQMICLAYVAGFNNARSQEKNRSDVEAN